jgi:hypothetical protein
MVPPGMLCSPTNWAPRADGEARATCLNESLAESTVFL